MKSGIVLLILIFMKLYLIGCSCDIISFEKAVSTSDEIFVGKIVKVEKHVKDGESTDLNYVWRYHFEVRSKWKGSKSSKIVVEHDGSSCDFIFDIYQPEYLIYGFYQEIRSNWWDQIRFWKNRKEVIRTWLCARTISEYSFLEENWYRSDIDKLDEIFPNKITIETGEFSWRYLIMLLFPIGLMIVGLRYFTDIK